MADNTELNAGTGGDVMRTDEIAGVKWPVCKIAFGADGTGTFVSSTSGMPTILLGKVSTNNSSTTPLNAGIAFTGTSDDITDYAAVVVLVRTDQDSASGGLSLQYSSDGTNWDYTEDHDVVGGVTYSVQLMTEARYFRVVYTNGGTNQTAFRLQVIYKSNAPTGEITALSRAVDDDDHALLVRSIIAAQKPDMTYANIQATAGGNLKVAIEEVDPSTIGVVSTVNSSATPLGIDGVFTGTSEDITGYASVIVNVFADQASATDGLSIEFSTDGTNWDAKHTHTIPASTPIHLTHAAHAQFFRVVYTNGGTGQSVFRLQIIYKRTNVPLGDTGIEETVTEKTLWL